MTGTCFETTHFLCAVRGEKTTAHVTQRPEKRETRQQRAWKISYEEVVAYFEKRKIVDCKWIQEVNCKVSFARTFPFSDNAIADIDKVE